MLVRYSLVITALPKAKAGAIFQTAVAVKIPACHNTNGFTAHINFDLSAIAKSNVSAHMMERFSSRQLFAARHQFIAIFIKMVASGLPMAVIPALNDALIKGLIFSMVASPSHQQQYNFDNISHVFMAMTSRLFDDPGIASLCGLIMLVVRRCRWCAPYDGTILSLVLVAE